MTQNIHSHSKRKRRGHSEEIVDQSKTSRVDSKSFSYMSNLNRLTGLFPSNMANSSTLQNLIIRSGGIGLVLGRPISYPFSLEKEA